MALPPSLKENPQFGVGKFGATAAFDGLLGLRFAWGTTFGLVLPNIDAGLAQLGRRGGIGSGNVFGPDFNLFSSASLKMLEEIGHGLTHTQAAAAEKYVTEAWAFEGIGTVIERVAEDAVQTRKRIRQHAEPRQIVRVVRPNIRAQIKPVARQAARAEDRAEAAERRVRTLEQRLALLERRQAHTHAIAIPGTVPGDGRIWDEIDKLKGRVGRLGKYAGLAALLAILAKVLEKMGVNYIRCRNVRNVGRALCGMDRNILNTLLAGATLIPLGLSLVALAEYLLSIEDFVAAGIKRGFREFRDIEPLTFVGYTGPEPPAKFTGYTGTLG